jgi:hypothetical protein
MGVPNKVKKQLVEGLWEEIEKAVYRSPDVRQTLARLTEIDPQGDVSEYNLHLDIEKLNRLIQEENTGLAGGSQPGNSLDGQVADDIGQLTLFRAGGEVKPALSDTVVPLNLLFA